MEQQPKLLLLKRQTIAHMGAAKVALDALAGASLTTGGGTLGSTLAGTKINLWYPFIALIAGAVSLLARAVIAHYMNVAVIKNPINTSVKQVVSQPDPIEEKT